MIALPDWAPIEGDDDPPVLDASLFAPFPYYGNKRRAAPLIWEAIGDVPNYVAPFFGAGGDLFGRPSWHTPKIETANDLSGQVTNVMRALKYSPDETAEHADWWVNELDLHARHAELVRRVDAAFVEQLRADPRFHDPELAGWWIWGIALWIGGGWCDGKATGWNRTPRLRGREGIATPGTGVHQHALPMKRPELSGNGSARFGKGVHMGQLPKIGGQRTAKGGVKMGEGVHQTKLPHLAGPMNEGPGVGYGRGVNSSEVRADILGFFRRLAARLRRVRITTGDFERVLTEAVTVSHGLTGVFLDPPYGEEARRCADLYQCDGLGIATRAREWALQHGDDPRYRIVLCGYEGEHDMPSSWRKVAWKSSGGSENAARERLWLSKYCEGDALGPLFARAR